MNHFNLFTERCYPDVVRTILKTSGGENRWKQMISIRETKKTILYVILLHSEDQQVGLQLNNL